MSYYDALHYLAQKTSVIELYDQLGGRVAVCPEWNGRVMTSTCEGLDGDGFGFVNAAAIDDDRYENFGGEDQWTISPLIHSYSVESVKESHAVLQRTLPMNDANGAHVDFHLSRSISLLNRKRIGTFFGDAVADALDMGNVSIVGYCTENSVRSQEKAWVASRLRGMFHASPHTCVIVCTQPENEFASDTLTSLPVEIDYQGGSPHGRIRHLPQALLLRADGHGRCQVTVPFSTSPPIFGAVEIRFGTLTLWTFELPDDSEENLIRIHNPGEAHSDAFGLITHYEINCFSAAQKLHPEDSLTYAHCTLHMSAANAVLDDLIQQIFSVSLKDISQKMFR